MPINHDAASDEYGEPVERSWDSKDSLLYSVGPVEEFLVRRSGDLIIEHDTSSIEIGAAELTAHSGTTIHVLLPAADPRASERSRV